VAVFGKLPLPKPLRNGCQ